MTRLSAEQIGEIEARLRSDQQAFPGADDVNDRMALLSHLRAIEAERDGVIEECARILDRRGNNENGAYEECKRQMIPDDSIYRHAAVSLLEAAREIRALKFSTTPPQPQGEGR